MTAKMLAPAAILIVWSLVMLFWMTRVRFKAFATAGIDLRKSPPGGRGPSLNGILPDKVMWKAHNHDHLMEQPTIFYPAVIILAIMGPTATDIALAWGYVALRIIHSLYQALVNRIPVRRAIFTLASICLGALALRAASATLFAA